MTSPTSANNRLVLRLIAVVVGMFGFGFALVPLYDVFCDITGINGKTDNKAAVRTVDEIDKNREITVEFITRTNSGMPWEFRAETQKVLF